MTMFNPFGGANRALDDLPGLACPARGLNMLAASGGASLGRAKDAMLDFLFRRLTAEPARGAALFSAATAEARRPHWFREGEVPDTLDGRFVVLVTILALILVRLERDGDEGDLVSVALTERFIAVMESEHRELGLGDPTLGKTVRKLVGSLAKRVELWRVAVNQGRWREAAHESLYKDEPPSQTLENATAALKQFWSRVDDSALGALAEGRFE
jgi:cytochrome b pre-mRNA-processing protein 3